MYCPTCGSEERQASQFCRVCGTDLRAVRLSVERPDSITASAVSARDEISRAVAHKIREVHDADQLKKVAENVLPELEKFLESPEEKRLRRVRAGITVTFIGLGTALMGLIMSGVLRNEDLEAAIWVGGLGIIAFALGLGLVLNGLLFTKPRKNLRNRSSEAEMQSVLDASYQSPKSMAEHAPTTSNLIGTPSAVTDHTTHHLKRD